MDQNIISIGVNDKTIDLFEGQYEVPDGISYNSYLIMDEAIAIMDTVDQRCSEEFLKNLLFHLNNRIPDYLIISHAEPDHASSLMHLLKLFPDICIIGNSQTFSILSLYFEQTLKNCFIVKDGDHLSLGRHRLTFFTAPMVHWPEVMVTYEELSGTLFSADAFGKFGTSDLPACQDPQYWLSEAGRYYFNIVGKYGIPVQTLLQKISSLPLHNIAPLHGPILQAPLDFYLKTYDLWSRYQPETNDICIVYASFHGNTAQAARFLHQELIQRGSLQPLLFPLTDREPSPAVAAAFRCSRLVLAAPSYDGGLMPFMENFLHHLSSKNFQNRQVCLIENGSWAPCAARVMKELLSSMPQISYLSDPITLRGKLKETDRKQLCILAELLSASDAD